MEGAACDQPAANPQGARPALVALRGVVAPEAKPECSKFRRLQSGNTPPTRAIDRSHSFPKLVVRQIPIGGVNLVLMRSLALRPEIGIEVDLIYLRSAAHHPDIGTAIFDV